MRGAEPTGLELMQGLVAGTLPAPAMAETIPMRIVEPGEGFVRFTARADGRHLNALGGVHGGFLATVLDTVTGCAIHTRLEAGVGYGTMDLNVKMVRPVPVDVELSAEGRVLNLSRRVGVAEGRIVDAEGRLCAHATTTCMILR